MKVMVIPIVVGILGTDFKHQENGLGDCRSEEESRLYCPQHL